MRVYTLVILCLTFAFYTLNFTGFKTKKFVLAESCLKDEPVDVVFLLLFAASLVTFIFAEAVGQFLLLGFFLLCVAVQYYFTFRFVLKPDAKKIAGYNAFFKNTHHIIPPSEKRLVPDTFHITLFALLLWDLANLLIYVLI